MAEGDASEGLLSRLGLRRGLASRLPGISSPPAESGDRQHTPHGLAFQGGRVGWLLGRLV